jgi:hypothetical protein
MSRDFGSQDFWHPSGVHFFSGRLPGVSSQAPQPPANFYQPSGLMPKCEAAVMMIRSQETHWHRNLNLTDRNQLERPNPEGCHKLAGGRSRTETPGKLHPGGVSETIFRFHLQNDPATRRALP